MHIGRRGPDARIAPRLLRGQERKRVEETKFGGRGSWVPRGIEERWLKGYWQDWLQGAENSSVGGVAVCECAGRFAACFLGRCEGFPRRSSTLCRPSTRTSCRACQWLPADQEGPTSGWANVELLRSIDAHVTVFSQDMCAKGGMREKKQTGEQCWGRLARLMSAFRQIMKRMRKRSREKKIFV